MLNSFGQSVNLYCGHRAAGKSRYMKYGLLPFETYFSHFKTFLSTRHIKKNLLYYTHQKMLVSLPLYYILLFAKCFCSTSLDQTFIPDISTSYCHIHFNCIWGSPGFPVLPILWWRPIVTLGSLPIAAHCLLLPPMVLGMEEPRALTQLQPGQHGVVEWILTGSRKTSILSTSHPVTI